MTARSAASGLAGARRRYAEELRYVCNIRSPALLRAFARVPRERFLSRGPWKILNFDFATYWATEDANPRHLYHNILVAIDPKRHLNNGQPGFLAFLFNALDIKAGERVAHIGCGTGYYTAILAETVGRQGRVVAFEVDPHLARRARRNLSLWRQAKVVAADGSKQRPDPADVVMINAGATHPLPAWLDALAPAGRMVMPLTTENHWGGVLKITRLTHGYAARFISNVGIFHCQGGRDKRANRLLQAAFETGTRHEVRSLRREPHKRTRSCWLHGKGYCLSRLKVSGTA